MKNARDKKLFRETQLRVIANDYVPIDATTQSEELEEFTEEEKESVGWERPSKNKGIKIEHKNGKRRQNAV